MSLALYKPANPSVTDSFGPQVSYLRLSSTDRCDLRCTYCLPQDMRFASKREVLSLKELERMALAFVRFDTRKIRIAGGEPLVRRDVLVLFRALSRHSRSGALEEGLRRKPPYGKRASCLRPRQKG